MKFSGIFFLMLISNFVFGQQKTDTLTKIEYQIISTSDEQFIINYNNEKQQYLGAVGLAGWTYELKTDKRPFTASLIVNRYPSNKTKKPEVILNILVNGIVVKSVTGKIGVSSGGQKVQYVVK